MIPLPIDPPPPTTVFDAAKGCEVVWCGVKGPHTVHIARRVLKDRAARGEVKRKKPLDDR